IHLGDIVQKNGDVLGDGVNIAARLQTLAEPGTICISRKVYEEVEKKLPSQARQLFEKAIELDPQYAEAYASLGGIYYFTWLYQWSQDPQALERAFELAQQTVTLDDSLPAAHNRLSTVSLNKKQYEQAIAEAERTITLAPNRAGGYVTLGSILNLTGQSEKAIGVLEQALRLDPHSPVFYQLPLGWASLLTRQCDEAIAMQKKI